MWIVLEISYAMTSASRDESPRLPPSACCAPPCSRATTMRRRTVAPDRHNPAVIEFPNDLEIVVRRDFDAPIQLVFDVATKPEHVRKTFAPFGEAVTVGSVRVGVGGDYHLVRVTEDGP